MTRGKHGQAAAVRHEVQEAQQTAEIYQRRVANLTAEVARLKQEAVDRTKAHSQEVKRLKAERNEGVSPTLRVLEKENRRLREEKDQGERRRRELLKRWEHVVLALKDHYIADHRMTTHEAVEAVGRLTPGWEDDAILYDPETRVGPHMTNESVVAVERARGIRR